MNWTKNFINMILNVLQKSSDNQDGPLKLL